MISAICLSFRLSLSVPGSRLLATGYQLLPDSLTAVTGIPPYPLFGVSPFPLPATTFIDCQEPFPGEPKELLIGATNAVKSAFIETASFFSRQRGKRTASSPSGTRRSAEERDQ
jgi:hypothetical protein